MARCHSGSTTSTIARRVSLRRSGSSRSQQAQSNNPRQAPQGKSSTLKKKDKKDKGHVIPTQLDHSVADFLCRPSVDEIIKQSGHWFSRAIDPFFNVKNAIVVGMKGKGDDSSDKDEDDKDGSGEVAVQSKGEEEKENMYVPHIWSYMHL